MVPQMGNSMESDDPGNNPPMLTGHPPVVVQEGPSDDPPCLSCIVPGVVDSKSMQDSNLTLLQPHQTVHFPGKVPECDLSQSPYPHVGLGAQPESVEMLVPPETCPEQCIPLPFSN